MPAISYDVSCPSSRSGQARRDFINPDAWASKAQRDLINPDAWVSTAQQDTISPVARWFTVTQFAPTTGPFSSGFSSGFQGNAIGTSPIAWTSAVTTQTPNLGLMGIAIGNPLIDIGFVGPTLLSWSTGIRKDVTALNNWFSTIPYDVKLPISRSANTRWDYQIPTKSNDNSVRWDILSPIMVRNSIREDALAPQNRGSIARQDTKPPVMWSSSVVNIASDVLSPVAWNSLSLKDVPVSIGTSATTREDILTRHQILNSQSRDVLAPVSSSALTREDAVVPQSRISGVIREDGVLPLAWLYDVQRDYTAPIAWVSQLIQVAWDVIIPVSWGASGIRLDLFVGLAYTSTVRIDFNEPLSYGSVGFYDALSPIEQRFISKQDVNTPDAWRSTATQDTLVWLSWNGSTFPLGTDDYLSPISWGVATQSDINIPVAWAGGVNPIQGDWLSPVSWSALEARDIRPPMASGTGIIRDVVIPTTWRTTASWDALEPQGWVIRTTEDMNLPAERRFTGHVDYVSRISWSGVAVAISYDALSPVAWGTGIAFDQNVPFASDTAVVRLDGLVPFKTSAAFQNDVSAVDAWSAKVAEDTIAGLASSAGIRSDYLVRLGWTSLTYNVSYDANVPLAWGAVWNLDLNVPAVSSSAPVQGDVIAPIGLGSSAVADVVLPLATNVGWTADVTVPLAWTALSGTEVSYDALSLIAWGTAGFYDDPSPIGWSVALTDNALVPVEWDGKPFTPDPQRTVIGPGGVRIAIP